MNHAPNPGSATHQRHALGSRRNRLLALGAIVAVALVVLVVALIATGGSDTPARTTPAPTRQPQDPYAADRAAIQRVAETWRRSLNPQSPDNPCRYMTPQAQDDAMTYAAPSIRAKGCAAAVRAQGNQGNVPLYEATQSGLARITFSSRVPVAGLPSQAPGAQGTWRAQGYPPVSLVRRNAEWKVAG